MDELYETANYIKAAGGRVGEALIKVLDAHAARSKQDEARGD